MENQECSESWTASCNERVHAGYPPKNHSVHGEMKKKAFIPIYSIDCGRNTNQRITLFDAV